jgi:hypothetical protein
VNPPPKHAHKGGKTEESQSGYNQAQESSDMERGTEKKNDDLTVRMQANRKQTKSTKRGNTATKDHTYEG